MWENTCRKPATLKNNPNRFLKKNQMEILEMRNVIEYIQ